MASYARVDVQDVWRSVENQEKDQTRSLTDIMSWACGRDLQTQSWNAGDNAARTIVALESLLLHEDVWKARWHLFGAHTLDQIPSASDVLNRSTLPRMGWENAHSATAVAMNDLAARP